MGFFFYFSPGEHRNFQTYVTLLLIFLNTFEPNLNKKISVITKVIVEKNTFLFLILFHQNALFIIPCQFFPNDGELHAHNITFFENEYLIPSKNPLFLHLRKCSTFRVDQFIKQTLPFFFVFLLRLHDEIVYLRQYLTSNDYHLQPLQQKQSFVHARDHPLALAEEIQNEHNHTSVGFMLPPLQRRGGGGNCQRR